MSVLPLYLMDADWELMIDATRPSRETIKIKVYANRAK
jgi:hypothetical protein